MRISLIHGDNSPAAYEKYRALIDGAKVKNFQIITINSPKEVVGQSLFDDKIVFILEKPKKVNIKDWKWLKENAKNYNSNLLVLYEGNAPVTVTRNFPKDAKILKHELPKILFQYLDNLYPNNPRLLKLFNDVIKLQAVELILAMMARQFRDLYWVKVDATSIQIPDWRVLKLLKQADKFEENDLKKIINRLAKIDIQTKTSDTDLKTELDLFLIEELK